MRLEQAAADKGGMTLAEVEAWVAALRAQGAGGGEVVRARVGMSGRLRSVSAEVTEGASSLSAKSA